MGSAREFLNTKRGKAVGIAVVAVSVTVLAIATWRSLGPSATAKASRERTFICAEAGKSFEHTLVAGERIPVHSPHSGKASGYPAELCYWTTEGRPKDEPTAVLLGSYRGDNGPTFCPECSRLVIGHNPRPQPGTAPPPTRAEFAARTGWRGPGERF